MKIDEARRVLDAARHDRTIPTAQITLALTVTGDIDDGGWSLQTHQPVGSWERHVVPSMLRPAEPFDGLLAA